MNELGKWIINKTTKPFYARKVFDIDKEIRKAEIKICGLGQFVLYINGKKIGDHELDPGWTNYRKLIEYVTFDVAEYIQEGRNVIGAEVGNGWFIKDDEHYTFKFPEFMPIGDTYKPFGKDLVLSLSLEIEFVDGSREVIEADDSFSVHSSAVTMSNVYGSETVDRRLLQNGWNDIDFDDSMWHKAEIVEAGEEPKGKLINQFQPAVKVIKSYDGKFVNNVNNREVYDFGQNMSAMLEFKVKGKSGDVIKVYPAEKLDENGDVDQVAKNWVTVDSCITYIVGEDDTWETFRMKFSYFAGRYIAVEKSNKGLEIKDIKADAISSVWKKDGSISCDDKRYEQIYDIVEKAVEANMVSVHTDCPTIERFAWQEPNHLMAPSIMFMKDGRKLWEKFLLDMRTEQHTAEDYFLDFKGEKFYPGEGLMPSQCPCYIPNVMPVPGMGSFYDIIPWGSTCILGTFWHYYFYGDVQIIKDNYDAGMKYLEHLKTKVNDEGFINHGLGDWGNPENLLTRENVETAFLYADAITLEKFASILGKSEDEKELHKYAEQIRDNYNNKLLVKNPDTGLYTYRAYDHQDERLTTQSCLALPLFWGMVPEDKLDDIVKSFKNILEEKQSFSAGEVGLPYIIQSARKYGMNDLIAEFILREEHPSYYAFVLDGETTLGEYWEKNPRSHCHDMMGHIVEWYYNGIAGIQNEAPGFKKIKICPYLPKTMNEFKCSYSSINGEISVHIKAEHEKIILEVKIPKGIEYEIDTSNLELRNKNVEVQILD